MEGYLYHLRDLHDDTECRAVARRELILKLWRRYRLPAKDACQKRILEIGCGTGATLKSLCELGIVYGVDVSLEALQYCRTRGIDKVLLADGAVLPFADYAFDLVLGIDVLEHIEDDINALNQFYRVLKPQGTFIGIVPAYSSLCSSRDVRLGHKRRYSRRELKWKVEQVGFALNKLVYLDVLALPVLYLWVKAKAFHDGIPDIKMDVISLPRLLNTFLLQLMRLETSIFTKLSAPFGVALLCVARRL